ncbi:globin CTT-I/CTT-IA-like [Phlebotomus argentipes]|uniref:globin CTT-I/CTT-IA-like n=1 Tax=Phlebotomus argentipes TaxID=94469 RepID=UPI0028934D9C|nr:globin CTT-I/CTT-IA-like [Phlebotomus argentipes]
MAIGEEQMRIVKSTWKIVAAKAPTDTGAAILLRLFEKYPHNQNYFAFRDVPLTSLKGSCLFRSHAGRIVEVFQHTIDAFDTPNAMTAIVDIWSDIARTHSSRMIKKQSYDELKEVLLEVLTEMCKLDLEQKTAWSVTLDTLFSIVSEKLLKLSSE